MSRKPKIGSKILFVVIAFAATAALTFAIVYLPGKIGKLNVEMEGDSMASTILNGEKLIIEKSFYLRNGDIVYIDCSRANLLGDGGVVSSEGIEQNLIKRVIAMGGQTVEFDFSKGKVLVDDEPLDEPYVQEPTYSSMGNAFEYPITVPAGYVYVLGDNRNNARDSRDEKIGLIAEEQILGKIVLKINPEGKKEPVI